MGLPVILQADRSECGLACLAMIAGYYGYRSTLRELRTKFRVSLRGTTLASLREYGEQLGLTSRALRLDPHELAQLRTPAILHWDLDHFVVLKAQNSRNVTVVDPAVGTRRLGMDDFSSHFTGVALEFSSTPAFREKQDTETIKLSAFFHAFKGLGQQLTVVFTLVLLLQLFALVMPLNVQFTVDQGIRQGDMNIVFALAAGFGLVALIAALTNYFRSMLVLYIGNTTAYRLVSGLTHHLLRLSDSWFTARHTGDILSRFGSVAPVRDFLMTGAFAMLVDAFMAIGAFAVLMFYAWELTLALGVFLILFALLRFATYVPLRHLTHEAIAADALENSSFIENVQRHRAIKLLGAEADREDAWGERFVVSINTDTRLSRFGLHLGLAGSAIGSIEGVVMLLLGANKVIQGDFTLGMLFAFHSYGGIFSGRVHALIDALVDLRMLQVHQERIADIGLEEREVPVECKGIRSDLSGAISVRSLCFSYNDEEGAVLEDVNLDIASGEFVAIAGESGKGKTTFIKLICKLLTPTEGEIQVDGIDLRQLDTVHYRRQIGVVMQDDDLFSGSLIENIAMGETQPDPERVERAARLACIHEDIRRMPMRYLTLVGHMGSTLSGGQRQRVMLARAIYRNPSMLLLDEGTAHLNESLQEQVLTHLTASGATLIIASHDPRVLERANRCIYL